MCGKMQDDRRIAGGSVWRRPVEKGAITGGTRSHKRVRWGSLQVFRLGDRSLRLKDGYARGDAF